MILFAVSASIVLALGCMHLWLTLFQMHKLSPRDAQLVAHMRRSTVSLTSETDLWRLFVGFNVTHSIGLVVFGLLFLHAALEEPLIFSTSIVQQSIGLAALLGYSVVARLCFFSVPFRGILLATLLWAAAMFTN